MEVKNNAFVFQAHQKTDPRLFLKPPQWLGEGGSEKQAVWEGLHI